MQKRIIRTEEVCERLGGVSHETLRQFRMQYPDLLTPIMRGRYSAEKVEKLIDILTGIDSQLAAKLPNPFDGFFDGGSNDKIPH